MVGRALHCPEEWAELRPIAADVQQVIEAAGMTRAQVAAALGLTRSAVDEWLSGTVRIDWPAWRLLLEMAHHRD